MSDIVQKILRLAAEQVQLSPEQKQDPNVVKQMLLQNLGQSIGQEVVLNQIYPDVIQRGLAKTIQGKNGVIIFQFKNNTQKMWNPQTKEYGEMQTQQQKANKLNSMIRKALADRIDTSWTREVNQGDDAEKSKQQHIDNAEKAKQDPNAVYTKLNEYLGKMIPADVIYTQILPSVTSKGLESTNNVGGGKIVFKFKDGTQGIWSDKNKKYTEAIAKKDYKRTILRKAMKNKKPLR
jgi:hypothetical protein